MYSYPLPLPPSAAPQDQGRVYGGLLALRLLTRKYEFRDEEERGPLEGVITTAFPMLLHIFRQLLQAPASGQVGVRLQGHPRKGRDWVLRGNEVAQGCRWE